MTATVGLKKIAKAFLKSFKGELRPAAAKIGERHNLIDNWIKRKNRNIDKLFVVLEKIRIELGYSKEKMWDILTNGKK